MSGGDSVKIVFKLDDNGLKNICSETGVTKLASRDPTFLYDLLVKTRDYFPLGDVDLIAYNL